MRILVTGIAGFVGHYLADELNRGGHDVVGVDLSVDTCPAGVTQALCADLVSADSMASAVAELQPDACVHLGGISSPPIGRTHPERMLNTNILGTMHVLEALRREVPAARVLLASTSYIYGGSETDSPVDEDTPVSPVGVYAVSKAAADMMTLAYARNYGMHTMTARASNHTGPGQASDFVVAAFAAQVRAIQQGTAPAVMRVGNLASERCFMDVRDVVRAYRLLIEGGQAGQAYNVAPSERVSIQWVLDQLCGAAGIAPAIEVDEALYRPTDRTPLLSSSRIRAATGWRPEIPFAQTLRDILQST